MTRVCSKQFTAVDLFAGGGGVTAGLKLAGFNVVAAVENDLQVIDTYVANHPETHLFSNDIRFVSGKSIKELLPKERQLDLLAGCPPCQGFSSLTHKYKREDKRNNLILEMGRLVQELRPKAVMVENVPGISSKGNKYLEDFKKVLSNESYKYATAILQVADYGVPQQRRRFVLLAGLGEEIPIPQKTHSSKQEDGLPFWRSVAEALEGINQPIKLSDSLKEGGPKSYNWNVIRDLSPINKERIKHVKPGGSRYDIPDALRPDCHKGLNKGFPNVYGRMSWTKPSPTITGGCKTLSKGRFGHPEDDRTISVRESARLQTFSDDYIFDTEFMDVVCKIIGNALPVRFSLALGEACRKYLSNCRAD
jgi:DNA (cytosine-5)-methyltransferase 1